MSQTTTNNEKNNYSFCKKCNEESVGIFMDGYCYDCTWEILVKEEVNYNEV